MDRRALWEHEVATRDEAQRKPAPSSDPSVASVLALQRSAGNAAVCRMIQRQEADEAARRRERAQARISTPLPADSVIGRGGRATAEVNGVRVVFERDVRGGRGRTQTRFAVRPGRRALVRFGGRPPTVIRFQPPGAPTVTIRTSYRRGDDPEGPSAYGRGTTPEDQAAGQTTLRHHEGSHGTDYLDFMREHPYPELDVQEGMTREEVRDAERTWRAATTEWSQEMEAHSLRNTDCVGVTIDEELGVELCD